MTSENSSKYVYERYNGLTLERLEEILSNFSEIRISVLGDAALDVYWHVDMTRSKLSRETPNFPLPVIKERFSPGAAANVAANLAALGVSKVNILTVIGDDWRGRELRSLIVKLGINEQYIIKDSQRLTTAYCKPLKKGVSDLCYEDSRIDFENTNPLSEETESEIKIKIVDILKESDGIVVVDQLENGIITESIRGMISNITVSNCSTNASRIIVDSRENINRYQNITLKPNQLEAALALYENYKNYKDFKNKQLIKDDNVLAIKDDNVLAIKDDNVLAIKDNNIMVIENENIMDLYYNNWKKTGIELSRLTGSPILMTLGEKGAAYIERNKERNKITEIPTIPGSGEIDIVGAGDAFLAAYISSLSAGALVEEAVFIANLAAAVTIKKIQITGTASRKEILTKYTETQGGR